MLELQPCARAYRLRALILREHSPALALRAVSQAMLFADVPKRELLLLRAALYCHGGQYVYFHLVNARSGVKLGSLGGSNRLAPALADYASAARLGPLPASAVLNMASIKIRTGWSVFRQSSPMNAVDSPRLGCWCAMNHW